MKIIWFNGNLGNQVFYCKYKDYLKDKFPNQRIFAFIDPRCPKISVDKYFNLEVPEIGILTNILSFIVFKVIGALLRRIPQKYTPKWYCESGELNDNSTFFAHNLQLKYFYEREDSSWLQVKMNSSVSSEYVGFASQIANGPSVAVHLRRGDYIRPGSAYVDLSSTDYYEKAMAKAKDILPNCQFYFFSDDLDFVRGKFTGDNIHYVDCNRGDNSYLDIKLMSFAKINIMANSTFSYWGAYMNHEQKTIIYPKAWFREWTGRKSPDIMLDSWIGI